MTGSVAIVIAIITALGSATVGILTLRATAHAASAKGKTDENAQVLSAWRELNQPLREENARLLAQLEREREEHAAVLKALEPLNAEIDRRRKGKRDEA